VRGVEASSCEFSDDVAESPILPGTTSRELQHALAEIKGQAQFLLYLADQIEESLDQLAGEADACHGAFLCKVLGMYSGQLETKHQGLGERIAEACQEVYVTVREREMA
jgi:hypothetical protein